MSDQYCNTTPADILEELAQKIEKGYASSHSAKVTIAADPAHAIELLAAGRPGGMSIVVFYLGDSSAGDESLSVDTLVSGQIRVACVKHPGLDVRPGNRIPGVLTDSHTLRNFIRRISSTQTVTGVYEYAGMTYLKTEGSQMLHGYALTFNALYADEV